MIHYIYDYAFIAIYLLLQNLFFSCNNYKHFLANKSLKAMTKSTTIKKKGKKKNLESKGGKLVANKYIWLAHRVFRHVELDGSCVKGLCFHFIAVLTVPYGSPT